MMRVCKKCGEEKPIEEFLKKSGGGDPYQHRCKKCRNAGRLVYIETGMRICRKCGEEKLVEDFVKRKNCRQGRSSTCKVCSNKTAANWKGNKSDQWLLQQKENHKKHLKKYFETHKNVRRKSRNEYNNKYNKNSRDTCSDRYIHIQLQARYGLSKQTLKRHPELTENYRMQIKVKRLLKKKKNENTKTS